MALAASKPFQNWHTPRGNLPPCNLGPQGPHVLIWTCPPVPLCQKFHKCASLPFKSSESLISRHMPSESSEDPSNLFVDPLEPCRPTPWPPGTLQAYPLTPWDPAGLPLYPLGPCRKAPPWLPGTLKAYTLTPWDPLGPLTPTAHSILRTFLG